MAAHRNDRPRPASRTGTQRLSARNGGAAMPARPRQHDDDRDSMTTPSPARTCTRGLFTSSPKVTPSSSFDAAVNTNGPSAYVTGVVELDAGQIASILQRPDGHQVVRAVVLHELGNLVGLGDVTVVNQLMNPQIQTGVTDFGTGHLTGLAALGKGTCLPDL